MSVILAFLLTSAAAFACNDYSGDWVLKSQASGAPTQARFRFTQTACDKLVLSNLFEDLTTEDFTSMTLPSVKQSSEEKGRARSVKTEFSYFSLYGELVQGSVEVTTGTDGIGATTSKTQIWHLNPELNTITINTLELTNGVDEQTTMNLYRTR